MEFKPEKKDEIMAKRRNRKLKMQGKCCPISRGEVGDNSPLAKRLKSLKEQERNQL